MIRLCFINAVLQDETVLPAVAGAAGRWQCVRVIQCGVNAAVNPACPARRQTHHRQRKTGTGCGTTASPAFGWARSGYTGPVCTDSGSSPYAVPSYLTDLIAHGPCIRKKSPSRQPSFFGGTVWRKTVRVPPSLKPTCRVLYHKNRAVCKSQCMEWCAQKIGTAKTALPQEAVRVIL